MDFCEEGHLGFLSPIAIDALILFPLLSVKGFSDNDDLLKSQELTTYKSVKQSLSSKTPLKSVSLWKSYFITNSSLVIKKHAIHS